MIELTVMLSTRFDLSYKIEVFCNPVAVFPPRLNGQLFNKGQLPELVDVFHGEHFLSKMCLCVLVFCTPRFSIHIFLISQDFLDLYNEAKHQNVLRNGSPTMQKKFCILQGKMGKLPHKNLSFGLQNK